MKLARRESFALSASGVRELTEQLVAARAIVDAVKDSLWVRIGRLLNMGPDIRSR